MSILNNWVSLCYKKRSPVFHISFEKKKLQWLFYNTKTMFIYEKNEDCS